MKSNYTLVNFTISKNTECNFKTVLAAIYASLVFLSFHFYIKIVELEERDMHLLLAIIVVFQYAI